MNKVGRSLKVVALALLMICFILIIMIVDLSPSVDPKVNKQVENAENVSALITQLQRSLKNRYQAQQIEVSFSQAQSLLGFTQRAIPSIRSDLQLVEGQADIYISYKLPPFFFSSYINLVVQIIDADKFLLQKVSVGAITIPGSWALALAEVLTNSHTNSEVATKAIQQISKTVILEDRIIMKLNPMDALLREMKNIKTSSDGNENQLLRIKIAYYLRILDSLPLSIKRNKDTSLSYYLHEMMTEAKLVSAPFEQDNGVSAALENEAAIMALAIYAGNRRFSNIVGDLSFAVAPIPTAVQRPVLANREDLSLHFIFSAAIKLLSEQGISIAVGEFKELMDRGNGGSGYSFVDLAADMAGANFAALAVQAETAHTIQNLLSSEANEMMFFPSINGLVEGMNKIQFKQKYGNIESEAYDEVISDIEMRLANLPINRLH